MLDPQFIREYPDRVKTAIQQKNTGSDKIVDRVLELDASYRACLTELQEVQAEANTVSTSIGELIRAGDHEAADEAKSRAAELKTNIKKKDGESKSLAIELNTFLLEIPNIPHESVPVGKDADDNQVVFYFNRGKTDNKILFTLSLPGWESPVINMAHIEDFGEVVIRGNGLQLALKPEADVIAPGSLAAGKFKDLSTGRVGHWVIW